jgi:hypothetical protein
MAGVSIVSPDFVHFHFVLISRSISFLPLVGGYSTCIRSSFT